MRSLDFDTIYSPDDPGYYAETYDETGRIVHVTGTYAMRSLARQSALKWIEDCQENKP